MVCYELLKHGTSDFPIAVHDTRLADGFRLFTHFHHEIEFLVITKGTGKLHIDGIMYELGEGDGVLINSEVIHGGDWENRQPSEFFAIVFHPQIFGNTENNIIAEKFVAPVTDKKRLLPVIYKKTVPWQNNVLNKVNEIHEIGNEKPMGYELLVKSKLFDIWYECFRHGEKSFDAECENGTDEIKSVIEYIKTEYASQLTLEDMANSVSMSRSHLCRKFANIVHMTPFEYLLHIRIDRACEMLKKGKYSVGEISSMTGFNSFSYFSMKFREIVGMSPTQYMKNIK